MTTPITQRGLALIDEVFAAAHEQERAVFIPYFPVGYPDYETSLAVLKALTEGGADIIEIGVPFSDPLADGPTIQAATQKALENGITLHHCLEAIRQLRADGIQTPFILMGYINPFMAYGLQNLMRDSREAGVDGFIVPDMPPEEADMFQSYVEAAGLALPHFLAPTSNAERIRLVASKTRGYIYFVSVTGVTGTRDALPTDLAHHIGEIRTVTQQPIAVGFGISTPEHAKAVGATADGVIVGSALIKAAQQSVEAVKSLAMRLREALD